MMKPLVCLPTLNEQQSILKMITAIQSLGLDVLVCDAGSTDGTIEMAKSTGTPVIPRDKPGKGSGMQTALRYAKEQGYDFIVFIDCDETYPVNDIPKLLAQADKYDMVVGARDQKDVAFVNAMGNRFFNLMINVLFRGKLLDINSGMRALKVDTFLPLITADNFDVETQISCLVLKHRIPHLEIPIPYATRAGQSKVRYIDAIDIVARILKERFK